VILEHRHLRILAGLTWAWPDKINLVAVDLATVETVDGPHGPIDNDNTETTLFVEFAKCPRFEMSKPEVDFIDVVANFVT